MARVLTSRDSEDNREKSKGQFPGRKNFTIPGKELSNTTLWGLGETLSIPDPFLLSKVASSWGLGKVPFTFSSMGTMAVGAVSPDINQFQPWGPGEGPPTSETCRIACLHWFHKSQSKDRVSSRTSEVISTVTSLSVTRVQLCDVEHTHLCNATYFTKPCYYLH